jgi:hypothetical protein
LSWVYTAASLPAAVAAHWPTPPGVLGKKLHARRRELIAALDVAFASAHDSTGASIVNQILGPAHPGTTTIAHAVRGWGTVAQGIRFGGAFPEDFAADWSEVIPEAADGFAELSELGIYILRVN